VQARVPEEDGLPVHLVDDSRARSGHLARVHVSPRGFNPRPVGRGQPAANPRPVAASPQPARGQPAASPRLEPQGPSTLVAVLVLSHSFGGCKSTNPATDGAVTSDSPGTRDAVGGEKGSGDGAGSKDGGGSPYQPSAEFLRLMSEYAKAQAGTPADLDGDGTAEFVKTINADGSMTLTITNASGETIFERKMAADGSWTESSDGDADGKPEATMEFTPGPPAVLVRLEDTNLDGTMDTRTTFTFTVATRKVHVLQEFDADQDETWVKTFEGDQPMSAGACSGANCSADGCAPPKGKRDGTGNPNVNVDTSGDPMADDPAGRCSGAHASQIKKALDCAVKRNKDCLAETNSEQSSALSDALSGGQCPLVITCSNHCSAALTDVNPPWTGKVFGCTDAFMQINSADWDKMSDDERCGVMLHELLHWAGDKGAGDHDNGKDTIYGCGRYCGNCNKFGVGNPGSSNADCAKCANTREAKQKCGIKQTWEEGKCGFGEGMGICHKGLGCIMGRCGSCKDIRTKTCDGEELWSTFQCCATCSSGCDGSNDFPCGVKPWLDDTCSKKAPKCP